MMRVSATTLALLNPAHLYSSAEVRARPCPVPAGPGVYAWYFREIPPGVPTDDCVTQAGLTLLYAGLSPKAPPRNGRAPSRATLRSRIRYHLRGNAEGSTLRLSLGCLLAEPLGLALRRVGSGRRHTFTAPGEARLSDWLDRNAYVTWVVTPEPWRAEEALIRAVSLPLNLDQNRDHAFHEVLSRARSAAKARANSLPIAT